MRKVDNAMQMQLRLPAEAGHTDDSDTRNRGVKTFCSGVKESGGLEHRNFAVE